MPQNIPVDPDGRARFRKSLYDEEGDAIALVSVEVVEIDGNEVPEGPDRTPAWLADGYTTEDEQTGDGPLGKRRYLHLDFAIDTEHASIEKNTSYKIRVTAHDNFNPEKTFDFVYTNGVLDFSTLTGLVGHFAYRLQGGGNTNTLTNFGTGDDLVGNTVVAQPATFGGRGSWRVNSNTLTVADGLLPAASPADPWSLFFLFQDLANNTGLNSLFSQAAGTTNGLQVDRSNSTVTVRLYMDSVLRTLTGPHTRHSGLRLIEVHKSPAGVVSLVVNGVEAETLLHTAAMPAVAFELRNPAVIAPNDLAELIVIDGELTEAQKTQIRKALKALYPMSRHEVT